MSKNRSYPSYIVLLVASLIVATIVVIAVRHTASAVKHRSAVDTADEIEGN